MANKPMAYTSTGLEKSFYEEAVREVAQVIKGIEENIRKEFIIAAETCKVKANETDARQLNTYFKNVKVGCTEKVMQKAKTMFDEEAMAFVAACTSVNKS